jgi:hypothetical protein
MGIRGNYICNVIPKTIRPHKMWKVLLHFVWPEDDCGKQSKHVARIRIKKTSI